MLNKTNVEQSQNFHRAAASRVYDARSRPPELKADDAAPAPTLGWFGCRPWSHRNLVAGSDAVHPCSAVPLASFGADGQPVAAKRRPSVFDRARQDGCSPHLLDRRSGLSRRAWAPGWAESESEDDDITGAGPA